jgi:hypothetical protein
MGRGIVSIVAVLIALTLSGCVEGAPSADADAVGSAAAEAASVGDRYNVGDVLAEDDVLALQGERRTPFRAYQLTDDSHVLIDTSGPLPAVVQEHVEAAIAAQAVGPESTDVRGVSDYIQSIERAAEAESAKLGRGVVPVALVWDGNDQAYVWGVGGPTRGSVATSRTLEEALAKAEAWVNTYGGPARYVIAVVS